MKKRDLLMLDEQLKVRDLSLDVVTLMNAGLTEAQARETLGFFPDLDKAEVIGKGYLSMPKGRYASFSDYLAHINREIADFNETYGPQSLFEQEVAERSIGFSEETLAQDHYRKDRPWNSSHYDEHAISYEPN